jgi:hypothetical protein
VARPTQMTKRRVLPLVDARMEFDSLLSTDPYHSPFSTIRKRLSSFESRRRRALAEIVRRALRSSMHRNEDVRVGSVKILVALLPESFPAVASLLRSSIPTSIHEVHFSLFCFLDQAQSIGRRSQLGRRILREVTSYIRNVKSDPALAAWMAGDLLGEHWDSREAWPALKQLARSAKHPAGRMAAIHGLRHALGSAKGQRRSVLLSTLRHVASSDPSRTVRNTARVAIASKVVI